MKQLLRIDAKYRALVEELSEMWTFYRQAEDARLECGPESEALSLRARMELERQGIQIPHARRPALRADAVVSPRDPTELVEIVTEFCGTFFAAEVVLLSFEIVEHTGAPDPWILAVGRARYRGIISNPVAHFLIQQFAECALKRLAITHPQFSRISTRLAVVEREHGLVEDDRWVETKGPLEYRELREDWRSLYDELLMNILARNDEHEIAEAYEAEDDKLNLLGWLLISGDLRWAASIRERHGRDTSR